MQICTRLALGYLLRNCRDYFRLCERYRFAMQIEPLRLAAPVSTRFVLVTASLPELTWMELQGEFPGIQAVLGPGLHRSAPRPACPTTSLQFNSPHPIAGKVRLASLAQMLAAGAQASFGFTLIMKMQNDGSFNGSS
jgi:hypothetical protein